MDMKFLFLVVVPMICACGADLPEDKAKELIEVELGLPKLIEKKCEINETMVTKEGNKYVKWNSKAFEGLQKLVSDGYLRRNPDFKPKQRQSWLIPEQDIYYPTEQATSYLGTIATDGTRQYRDYQFRCSIFKEVFSRVEEILMDPHSQKRASVTFTTRWEPVEPYFSILFQEGCSMGSLSSNWLVREEKYYGVHRDEFLSEVTPYEARFTKYDKGWRIDAYSKMAKESWESKKRHLQTTKQ